MDRPYIGSEVRDWTSNFSPAILPRSSDVPRIPQWFILRYITNHQISLLRLLHYVAMPYKHLTYYHRLSRREAYVRAWFPGYMFLEFDVLYDNWGQILRMPGAIEFLGGPSALPSGVVEDLALRLPQKLARPSKLSCYAEGTRVRVKSEPQALLPHPLEGHEGTVMWADRRSVKVIAMIFNRPTEVKLSASEVELV